MPCLAAALAALHLPAPAEPAADPAAPVPRLAYRSVLPAPAAPAEADLPWRQANEEVGRFRRGHVDLLKWEQEQERLRPPADAPAAAPTAPHSHRHGPQEQ